MLVYDLPKKISKKKLGTIKDPIRRMRCLFAFYSDNKLYKLNEKQLLGLIPMMEGLVYHYNNWVKCEENARKNLKIVSLSTEDCVLERNDQYSWEGAQYELISYANTIGQMYYLFTSDKLKDLKNRKILLIRKHMYLKNIVF